eukprot:jgi/Phyca11/14911/fgenesh1_pg.PHYCAscaffold_10_\
MRLCVGCLWKLHDKLRLKFSMLPDETLLMEFDHKTKMTDNRKMDVILARFSAAELRVNCLTAVHDELQQANVQLLPALEVLKRASDVSTEDEEDQQKIAEPKEEVMPVEKKKAAKESIISPKIERNKAPDSKTSNHSIAIIDLSLSDEEKEPPVKEEKKEIKRAEMVPSGANGMSADVAKKAWVMLKTLQKLHKLYPVKTKGLHRLEPGFEDSDRVEKDFKHVTGYEVEVQYASDPSAKKEAFDELIDQLRKRLKAGGKVAHQLVSGE